MVLTRSLEAMATNHNTAFHTIATAFNGKVHTPTTNVQLQSMVQYRRDVFMTSPLGSHC